MKIYRHISVSMDSSVLRAVQNCLFILLVLNCTLSFAFDTPLDLRKIYSETVTPKLEVPADEVQHYSKLLSEALQNAGLTPLTPQFVVLVDRNPNVQAGILFWIDENGTGQLIGSSPVSTGRAAGFEHFETPLGVFPHLISNPDFRAEGSKNSNGIRGYGSKGMRVFDFGWQEAKKSWGKHNISTMRLQMHATDPALLEKKLGSVQSKGCIRIPASLNKLLDHFALLDAYYDEALAQGKQFWVLPKDRESSPWAGRYLVVVDSLQSSRPEWSPSPFPPPKTK